MVYIGSDDNTVYLLNAAHGFELHYFETGAPVHTKPAVIDGKVFWVANKRFVSSKFKFNSRELQISK